ncbi:MAG: hypothetical protein ACREAY_11320 [Nitrososphaera sp.]|uniref:hypothetical protein n=1 Tax=Nitrososphaera sp. TaxID=1971748 RepID=UPI003D6F4ACF
MPAKVIEYGANKPLRISLPDKYWSVLWDMSQMEGRDVEELATERLKQIISEDVIHDCDEGYYGKMLLKGWKETLKDDPYFKSITGS